MIESELAKGNRFLHICLTQLLLNKKGKILEETENKLLRQIYKISKRNSNFKKDNLVSKHVEKKLSSSIRLTILQEKGALQFSIAKCELEITNLKNFITKDLDLEIFGSISKVQTEILHSFFGYLTASFAAFFAFLRILS